MNIVARRLEHCFHPMLSGDIDRDEWRETIEFYLELKEEEAEMQNQQMDHAAFMKELRAKKLERLGLTIEDQKEKDVPKVAVMETLKEDNGNISDEGVGLDIDG